MPQAALTRDFHFEIPDGWVDRTMVAWSAPPVPGQPVTPNILVAYDIFQKGEDLAAYVTRQIKELMGKAKNLWIPSITDFRTLVVRMTSKKLLDSNTALRKLLLKQIDGMQLSKQLDVYRR